jgi:hypothetical protein
MTNIGSVAYNSASPLTSGGSLEFVGDESNHFLVVPNEARFAPGTGDFTIEWYQYVTSDGHAYARPFSLGVCCGNINSLLVGLFEGGSNNIAIQTQSGYHPFSGWNNTLNVWQHIAVVRSSGTVTIYQDGVAFNSVAIPDDIAYNPANGYFLSIGSPTQDGTTGNEGIASQYVGLITNMRYVVGTAVYTSDFTPSTDPLTLIPGTELLLQVANSGTLAEALYIGTIANNSSIISNGNAWTFGGDGNLTLPSNVSSINYANGSPYGGGGSANTGNVTFDDINIIGDGNLHLQPDPANAGAYLDIFISSGPDIHLVASQSANLILGKDEQSNVMTSWDGNVYIQSWDNNTNTQGGVWTFSGDGVLQVPSNATAAGPGTIASANGYPTLLAYGNSGGFDIHGGPELDWMNANDPANSFGNNTVLRNTMFINGGGLYIGMNENGVANVPTAVWRFKPDGTTIFPTLDTQRGDNPSGTIQGQTLLFGDDSQEAIISTPNGIDSIPDSQRLVINPGEGYQGGEGGDIYLWAGRGGNASGSGGDIKIRGGQGGANTVGGAGGSGGYIRMEAGDAATTGGYPGYIDITGGYSNTVGGYVHITGGQGATVGGDVKIYGGYGTETGGNVDIWGGPSGNGQSNEGNVNIQTGGKTWTFAANGTTRFPNDTINPGEGNLLTTRTQTGNAYTQLSQESAIWAAQTGDDTTAANPAFALISTDLFTTDTPTVYIQTQKGSDGIVNTWTFDNAGNLILPGSASIIKNNAEVSYDGGVTIQVSDLANAVVASPGSIVGNTYNNTGFTKIIFTDSTLYNALVTAGIAPETIVATTWSNGSTTQLNTYVYVQFPGSPDTFSLRPCDSNGNTIVGDWVFPSVVGTTVPANIAITSVSPSTFHTWNFVSDGNLTVPKAIVGAGYSRLDMVSDGPNTAYLGTTNNDTTALYLQENTVQLYANTDVYITANVGGTSQGWTFGADGNLTLPVTVLDVGLTEQTTIRSQRKIIPPYHWSAIINSAFPDPTVVYTATSSAITSMKVTVQVQHSGFRIEMFDVSATYTGNDTYYSVSNRLKPPTITDTTVLVNLNGSGVMQITLTINSGSKPAWITYDATEFGIPQD